MGVLLFSLHSATPQSIPLFYYSLLLLETKLLCHKSGVKFGSNYDLMFPLLVPESQLSFSGSVLIVYIKV